MNKATLQYMSAFLVGIGSLTVASYCFRAGLKTMRKG